MIFLVYTLSFLVFFSHRCHSHQFLGYHRHRQHKKATQKSTLDCVWRLWSERRNVFGGGGLFAMPFAMLSRCVANICRASANIWRQRDFNKECKLIVNDIKRWMTLQARDTRGTPSTLKQRKDLVQNYWKFQLFFGTAMQLLLQIPTNHSVATERFGNDYKLLWNDHPLWDFSSLNKSHETKESPTMKITAGNHSIEISRFSLLSSGNILWNRRRRRKIIKVDEDFDQTRFMKLLLIKL